jgi:hypothetical protein
MVLWSEMTSVWYAAYGSNLSVARLNYYREGGRPPGAARTYPGFRDRAPARAVRGLILPGTVYFAWESPVWTGGVAFYSAGQVEDWPREAASCGYLFTLEQFEDLVAQEMYREPGAGARIELDAVVRDGAVRLGEGRYETVLYLGECDGYPVLTCTAPWDPATVELRPPAPRYLKILAEGLRESHGWPAERIHDYLAGLPGVRGMWDVGELRALVDGV